MHNGRALTVALILGGCQTASLPPEPAPALRVEMAPRMPDGALTGRSVADAIALMRGDRFTCFLEYRPLDAELDPKPRAGQLARAPILACSRWDPSPERACIEERVVFDIDWPDAAGDPLAQLTTGRVVGQAFRCAPNWNRPAVK